MRREWAGRFTGIQHRVFIKPSVMPLDCLLAGIKLLFFAMGGSEK